MALLTLSNIKKSFGGVHALKDVSIAIQAGEIHAILGENGAGKSTLMKVISGAHTPDGGTLIFDGVEIPVNSPKIAQDHGIHIIYQEFSLVPSLSVTENIFLGKKTEQSWINRKTLHQRAAEAIESLGFQIDVQREVGELSVAEQQVVEIAKALSNKVRLLILDEPSAVLGTQEVHKLFTLLRRLRAEGVGIIYISHHLDELLELSDRITVLKDGSSIETRSTHTVDKDTLVELMVGRQLAKIYPHKPKTNRFADTIRVEDLQTDFGAEALSFQWRAGEILGVGGLVGAGRTEIVQALFGGRFKQSGRVYFNGEPVQLDATATLIRQGWGMVPEDRKQHGGLLNLSIRDNISLANLAKISSRWGFINKKKEWRIVDDLVRQLHIKIGSPQDPLSSLSGGNQQKVVLAKWLNLELKVLLVDEPTRGVDVGARSEIYEILQNLANQGVFILMVSSDMEELIGMADRVLVLREGRVEGTLSGSEINEERILRLAIGAEK